MRSLIPETFALTTFIAAGCSGPEGPAATTGPATLLAAARESGVTGSGHVPSGAGLREFTFQRIDLRQSRSVETNRVAGVGPDLALTTLHGSGASSRSRCAVGSPAGARGDRGR